MKDRKKQSLDGNKPAAYEIVFEPISNEMAAEVEKVHKAFAEVGIKLESNEQTYIDFFAMLDRAREQEKSKAGEQLRISMKQEASALIEPETEPLPRAGEYILHLLLPKKVREPFLGDLEEEYQGIHEQFGERPAKLWFYKQVLTSLWPMLQTTGRTLVKWGLLGWLEEVIRRIAH